MNETHPYATLEEAGVYFGERANSGVWDSATSGEKEAALKTATRDIYRNSKFYEEGDSEFSDVYEYRYEYDGNETRTIPNGLKEACCEQALYLLTMNRDEAIQMTRMGIASAKGTQFDKTAIPSRLSSTCIEILSYLGAEVEESAAEGIQIEQTEPMQR